MTKIGILTFHGAKNYGAFLQAYALCEKINSEDGITAEIVDFRMQKEIRHYSNRIKKYMLKTPIRSLVNYKINSKQLNLFSEARKKIRLSSDSAVSDDMEVFKQFIRQQDYDVLISGSDEVWKTDGMRGFPTPYWQIGDLKCRKFSYAASARNDFSKMPNGKIELLKQALNEFEFIGVRDNKTAEEVKKYTNNHDRISLCCDPTFLWEFCPNKENGHLILKKLCRNRNRSNNKIVCVMTEDNYLAQRIRNKLERNYVLVALYQWHHGYINGCELSPFEWMDVLAATDMIITSFFHATCFALKFGIPLIAFGTKKKSSKLSELAHQVGSADFYFANFSEIIDQEDFHNIVDKKINTNECCFSPSDKMLDGYNKMIAQIGK